jgi:agmatinase
MQDLSNFDPNSPGLKSNNIFGLPFEEQDAALVLLPVPWEVTVSYRPGAADGPGHIFNAAMQVDLFDPDVKDGWKKGFYMQPIDEDLKAKSDFLRWYAEEVIDFMTDGGDIAKDEQLRDKLKEINDGGTMLRHWVYERTLKLLKQGKKVGLIGGDHSTPLGFIKALGTLHPDFGILQIDAHADLRVAYEGFTYSHASIMYNVLQQVPEVTKLVQVGIRDYCGEELDIINNSHGRVHAFFDKDIKERQYDGATWKTICKDIVHALPQKVYISFDIDGLDPKLCPGTGTPVPGGFEMEQVFYLFRLVHESGRQIIGFDLNEVSAGKGEVEEGIDAIVGARVLFKLCNFMVA